MNIKSKKMCMLTTKMYESISDNSCMFMRDSLLHFAFNQTLLKVTEFGQIHKMQLGSMLINHEHGLL